MANVRLIPPVANALHAARTSFVANGRTYSIGASGYVDVPDFDASIAEANSWERIGIVGPTSARPSPLGVPDAGLQFIDTTVGATIAWTGVAWVNTATGAVV